MSRSISREALVGSMASDCLAVRVRKVNRALTSVYDAALRPFGLRASQMNVLVAVARLGEPRPAQVCRALLLEKSTLSRDVELLKAKGWVESDPPAGGRNQVLRMTPEGLGLLAKIRPAWEAAQTDARALLGDDGVEALRRMADRVGTRATEE